MAQLVDGQAAAFGCNFEEQFHSSAALELQNHGDWIGLDKTDQTFAWNVLAFLLIQNACAFQRRIVAPLEVAPLKLLTLARTRYDLPDPSRQRLATELLNTPPEKLDVNSLKIVKAFKPDFLVASKTGKLGVGLYCTLKALRRMWKPSVIEQERLNKQLTLMGERSPNSSLDLLSSRLALKYHLGAAGFRERQLAVDSTNAKDKSTRKWSTVRPVAASVMNKCVDHWADSSDVLSQDERFADTCPPPWCPSKDDVHQWVSVLDPRSASVAVEKSIFSVAAAAINKSLFRFWSGKIEESDIHQPCFSAVVILSGHFGEETPVTLSEDTAVFVFGEAVNRSVRILKGTWMRQKQAVGLTRPWTFDWAANVFLETIKTLASNSTNLWPLTVLAFPIAWTPMPVAGGKAFSTASRSFSEFCGLASCDENGAISSLEQVTCLLNGEALQRGKGVCKKLDDPSEILV